MRSRQRGVVFLLALLVTHTAEIAAVGALLAAAYNGEKVVQGAIELWRTAEPAELPNKMPEKK